MHKFSFTLAFIWTLVILIGCLTSSKNIQSVDIPILGYDKVLHALLYFALVILWLFYFYVTKTLSTKKYFLVFLSCFFYGVLIEVLQHVLTQDRTADVFDVLANTLGLLLGLLTFKQLIKFRSKAN